MRSLNARVFVVQGSFCGMQCISVVYFIQAFQRFGYDNTLIGLIMMLTSIALVVAQPLWGMAADKLPRTKAIVLGNCAVSCGLYFLFIYSGGYKPVVIATAVAMYALFQPMMHLIDAWVSKLIVDGHNINYGASRTGGSLFYALTSLGFGIVVSRTGMRVAPWLYLVMLGVMALAVSGMPDALPGRGKDGNARVSIKDGLAYLRHNRSFLLFVLAYFLMSFTTVPSQTYYSVVLYDLGGNEFHVGLGQFLQASCEVPMMILFETLRRKTGLAPRTFLVIALLGFSIKTALLGFAPSIGTVLVANMFQGVAYATFLPASLAYLASSVKRSYLATAQMFAVAVGSSLAAIVLNPVCGAIADALGTQAMLKLMFGFAGLGAAVLLGGTRTRRPAAD